MTIHLSILNPRLAEAGKIKIGHLGEERKKKNRLDATYQLPAKLDHFLSTKTERGKDGNDTYRLPVKLDHFLITKTERGKDGNFELDHELMEQLPKDKDGKIREIPILLSSDDIEEVFPTTLAAYHGRNLYCKGDGHDKATRFEIVQGVRDGRKVNVKTGRWQKVECPCNLLSADKGLQCKPHGTLWVTILAGEHTQIGARHSFRTTSWDSIRSILAGLQEIQRLVGTLVGPQLRMKIRPRKVTPKGTDRSKMVYVVHLSLLSKDIQELRERVLAQAQLRHNVAALAGRPIRLGLPAPGVAEGPNEQALLQQEFHPDAAPDEDDEADENEDDFDPTTGEVFDTGSNDWQSNPKPEDEPQEEAPSAAETTNLPDDHPIRTEVKELLTQIARSREVPDEEIAAARASIWRQACEAAEYHGLGWSDLTKYRSDRIKTVLRRMLERYNEDAEI